MSDVQRTALRFTDAALEAAYLAWSRQQALPLTRVGMIAATINYGLVFSAGTLGRPENWLLTSSLTLLTCIPVFAVGIALTSMRTAARWIHRYCMFAATLAGLHAVIVGNILLDRIDVGLAGLVVVTFWSTTIFRIRPVPAILAVLPSFLLQEAWLFQLFRSGVLAPGIAPLVAAMPVTAYVASIYTSFVSDRTARDGFIQDRTISEQRATIERLLQQEIAHQVAERSRAMGVALAKVSDSSVSTVRLEPGRTLEGRYQVIRALGAGGMGAVYEVERLTDHGRFALKVITGNVTGAQAARFAREAEIGARLRHPNLVQIIDIGTTSGAPYLVMELVSGKGLDEHKARFGDKGWAMVVLGQLAEGLKALHEAGVVHRDLKPANVLISGPADAPLARISDFGISRFEVFDRNVDPLAQTLDATGAAKGSALTQTGMLIGTPLYMAPEAAQGGQAVEKPADVFAFGLVAHQMLTGSLPFASPVVLDLQAGRSPGDPQPLTGDFDETLRAVLAACLAVNPARRPQMDQVCTVLQSRR